MSDAQPETGYARLGDDRIAYHVLGEGPAGLVLRPGSFASMDAKLDEPEWAHVYRRLARSAG